MTSLKTVWDQTTKYAGTAVAATGHVCKTAWDKAITQNSRRAERGMSSAKAVIFSPFLFGAFYAARAYREDHVAGVALLAAMTAGASVALTAAKSRIEIRNFDKETCENEIKNALSFYREHGPKPL